MNNLKESDYQQLYKKISEDMQGKDARICMSVVMGLFEQLLRNIWIADPNMAISIMDRIPKFIEDSWQEIQQKENP